MAAHEVVRRTQVAPRQAPEGARVPVLAVHWAAQAGSAVAIVHRVASTRIAAAAVEQVRLGGTCGGSQLLRLCCLGGWLLNERRLQIVRLPPAVEAAGPRIQRAARGDEVALLHPKKGERGSRAAATTD